MRILGLTSLLLATELLAFGQLDSDTLTSNVSRSINLLPDQGIFNIYVNSDLDTSLEQVVAALKASGVTAENLSNVDSGVIDGAGGQAVTTTTGGGVRWSFTLFV